MVASGVESIIAEEVVQFLRAPQDMSHEMRCWSIGALLDRRTQGWPTARIDELLCTIVSKWYPDDDFGSAFEAAFDTLAEDYLIYRCFPGGLPPRRCDRLRGGQRPGGSRIRSCAGSDHVEEAQGDRDRGTLVDPTLR